MNIVHVIAALRPHTGGPASSVPLLCGALAELGHSVLLLTATGPLAETVEAVRDRVNLVSVRSGPYWAADSSADWIRQSLAVAGHTDVVHGHGVWLFPNWSVAAACVVKRRPLLVSPRGMLSPWALSRSRLLKAVAWSLADRWALRSARVLHATSDLEADEIRALRIRRPIAMVPNGLDLEREFSAERLEALMQSSRLGVRADGRRVVFLSRIHPKKGLDLLLKAWGSLGDQATAHRLSISGPGEPAHIAALERELRAFGDGRVEYLGPASGDERVRLLLEADLLILPSHSENYGMVIVEALACGKPVITTTGTPWSSLTKVGCGWWVEPSTVAMMAALREALSLPRERLAEMGARGRRLVEREHSLKTAARRIEAVYEWVCGHQTRPECVTD